MKFNKLILISVLTFSAPAFSNVCDWSLSGFQFLPSQGETITTFQCTEDTEVVAEKTLEAQAVGAPVCGISYASGYDNAGDCITPDIKVAGGPGLVTRVIDDEPENPNCQVSSIGGGQGYEMWSVSCPGYGNVTVQKTIHTWCSSVSTPSNGYSVTGSCADYSVYKQ